MANAPKRRATIDDVARARDEGRAVELIDGELVEKAAPTFEHGAAQHKLGEALAPFNRGGGGPRGPGGWWIATEVDVLYPGSDDLYRHDAVGFRRDLHPSRPTGLPVALRPDWVCEILSTSTARNDLVKKQRKLHFHRVPHYWLLDPHGEVLTVLRWSEPGYIQALTATTGERVRAEPFEAVSLAVGELFGHDEL